MAVALHSLHSTDDAGSAGDQLPQLHYCLTVHGGRKQHSQVCNATSATGASSSVADYSHSASGKLSVHFFLLVVSCLAGGAPCYTPYNPLYAKSRLAGIVG